MVLHRRSGKLSASARVVSNGYLRLKMILPVKSASARSIQLTEMRRLMTLAAAPLRASMLRGRPRDWAARGSSVSIPAIRPSSSMSEVMAVIVAGLRRVARPRSMRAICPSRRSVCRMMLRLRLRIWSLFAVCVMS
jgi:hypothetical protein